MTKEELKEQDIRLNRLCFDYHEKEKRIAELEEKISILLSCKNCPDNKGGLLCQKEYEDKCLAQKIQYIKELEKENAELLCQKNRNKSCYSCANATERCFRNEIGCPCQKYKSWKEENAELKRDKSELCNAINEAGKACVKLNEKLSKAKGFIEKLLIVSCNSEILIQYPNCKEVLEARVALEQFLKECE